MLSVPFWKWQGITIPDNMKILHDRDAIPEGYTDQRYFRLIHDLKDIPDGKGADYQIRTAEEEDIPLITEIINKSYPDIRVTEQSIRALTHTTVYAPELWILAVEPESGDAIGCALADLDQNCDEGILEWVQVLPAYRRRGAGRLMVTELLRRMCGKALFATVSGSVDSVSSPEKLYRACGFVGSDIWHILRKEL